MKKLAAFNLSESEIRRAMDNSTTIRGASAFLHVSIVTFKKYAQMYYDHDSKMNLFDLHKANKKKRKLGSNNYGYSPLNTPIQNILDGKHPNYRIDKLQNRLIEEGILIEQCNICGFMERRITDYKVPLALAFMDGDSTNHSLENMELTCFNCFFLHHGDIMRKKYRVDVNLYKKDRKLI